MSHTIVFMRDGTWGAFTEAAICKFEAETGDPKTYLMEALTAWVKTTESGKSAWEFSQEDFNIGDLALYANPGLLSQFGVYKLDIEMLDFPDNYEAFDTVLINRNEL